MSLFHWRRFCLIFLIGILAQCGSSSSSQPEDASTTAAQDLAAFVKWAGFNWNSVAPLLDDTKDISAALPITCSGGGTIDLDGTTITINDCIDTESTSHYLSRGTYTVTVSGSLSTHEWDQTILIDENGDGTFANSEPSFTTTGSISFDTTDDLIAYDYSAVFGSRTIELTGIVSDHNNGTSDVTFTILLDGTAWQDGSFTNTDLSSLTDSDVDSAVTADTDSCDTMECYNDFQCQLFADGNSTDAFETSNTVCTAGCCALNIQTTESDCPGSSTCTNDFACQLFADDDPNDAFTTANVSCNLDTGCCVAN